MTNSEPSVNRAQDPWVTAGGFRVVPVMDAQHRTTVEIDCPDRSVVLTTVEALELAEHLTGVLRTAEAWRGSRS